MTLLSIFIIAPICAILSHVKLAANAYLTKLNEIVVRAWRLYGRKAFEDNVPINSFPAKKINNKSRKATLKL